jgi:adenine-specific DNA methylase
VTRLIERWFPCDEVSEHSARGWGSGSAEKSLFTWFASRPVAQAKAAVVCSLLPWPDTEQEQEDLKQLVRDAMAGYDAANDRLRVELAKHYPDGAGMCDPFSGRAMIPLEAARLGVQAWGIDYSPVATLAGLLLADYPMRDWDNEPPLPFDGYGTPNTGEIIADTTEPRLLRDVRFVLDLVGERYTAAMDDFYPIVDGKRPWGYVWAVTLPCGNCSRRFPLTGSLKLRNPSTKKNDPGQSYRIVIDPDDGTFTAEVHDGPPTTQPTLIKTAGRRGKTAVCSFCGHAHDLETLKRMMRDGLKDDAMLVVADIDDEVGKRYRSPSGADVESLAGVAEALAVESDFGPGLPAVPHERLDPSLSGLIGPAGYGYRRWGELCNPRQTLGVVRLARIINALHQSMVTSGVSTDYAAALTGYAASNLVRRMKYSTRSTTLQEYSQKVSHVFFNDSGVGHSFDYFETGCGAGPATWGSLSTHTLRSLNKQLDRVGGTPATIMRGNALGLPMPDGSLAAVVMDPPYDAMINYCDSSDLLYVWLKRALVTALPWFGMTTDPDGLQDKTDEAVIKRGKAAMDHRTEAHYKRCITEAFAQARRKTTADGVVSIVFGHGDPDAWARVLTAIGDAGLVLTGSWPASTEKGGKQTGEHIDNTIMMACRAANPDRQPGDVRRVDEQIRERIADLVPRWQADGLADSDQRMAAIAPAMEIAGAYSYVHDFTGAVVPIEHFMGLAHKAVEEAANIRVDRFSLKDFDIRTRFALAWARQHGRRTAAASEARWQRLSYDITDADAAGLLVKDKGGTRFAYGAEASKFIDLRDDSPAIDIALAVAAEGREMNAIADVLQHLGRDSDEMLWSAMAELPRLLGEADHDGQVWTWAVRNRNQISTRAETIRDERYETAAAQAAQPTIF